MTREGTRLIAAFAAAILAAALLSACGGSDSTATDAASASREAPSGEDAGGSGEGGGSAGKSGGHDEGGGGSDGGSGSTAPVATPLRVSGGGSGQFRTEGGDNSIQDFGEESSESELQEAAEAVHSFFVARAKGDWAAACSRMAKPLLERLEQLAASSTQLEDKGCASFLEAFTTRLPASTWREITTVDAGGLRREGEQGFLLYYGAEKTVYAMPLIQEDDRWKVTALSGDALS